MKLHYATPREYRHNIPMLDEKADITDRVRTGLENILSAYVEISKKQANLTDNNIANYKISEVYIVGSGARVNKIDSDMDLLLIAPNLDTESAKNLKVILSLIFFTDRPKLEAIDVFIRDKDIYPERTSVDITSQIKYLLDRYNGFLFTQP